MAVLLLLCLQDGMADLIGRWRSDRADVRDAASADVLSRADDWSDDDLALLERAAAAEDVETAARAGAALKRIRLHRDLGPTLPQKFPDLEARIEIADEKDRRRLLQEAMLRWTVWDLDLDDFRRLMKIADDRGWDRLPLSECIASPTAPWIAAYLDDPKLSLRRRAAEKLAAFGDVESASKALPILANEPGEELYTLLNRIVERNRRDLGDAVVALLEDPGVFVRLLATRALGNLGDRRHVEAVRRRLDDEAADVRWSAALALSRLNDTESAGRIAAMLADEDVRPWALLALSAIGTDAEAVKPLLDDPDPRTALLAARALGLTERIVGAIDDPALRTEAIAFLAAAGAVEHVEAVRAQLENADAYVRYAAARAFADLGGATDEIAALLSDSDVSVREAAATVLAQRGATDLADRIKDRTPAAIRALGSIGRPEHLAELDPRQDIDAVLALGAMTPRLSGDERERTIEALKTLAAEPIVMRVSGPAPPVPIAARIALIHAGDSPLGDAGTLAQELRLRGGSTTPLTAGLVEALTARLEPDARRWLQTPVELKDDLREPDQLAALLREAGYELDAGDRAWMFRKHRAGMRVTPLTLLLSLDGCDTVVPDGKTLKPVMLDEALDLWIERLAR